MNRDEHHTFIQSDLADIMREVVRSADLLGDGLEFYAVNGYLLQSLFLQMTGAQEQKMKCICWMIATNDLAYRQKRYYNGWSLSQCSTLVDKSHVFEDLLGTILRYEPTYHIFANNVAKDSFRNDIFSKMLSIFDGTNIVRIHHKKYEVFKNVFSTLSADNITPSNKLIFKRGNPDAPISGVTHDTELFAIYTLLYRHRNRCAHNTPSYQLNLPHLIELKDELYQKYDNIFLYFATLLMIDGIFRKLYEKYISLVIEVY